MTTGKASHVAHRPSYGPDLDTARLAEEPAAAKLIPSVCCARRHAHLDAGNSRNHDAAACTNPCHSWRSILGIMVSLPVSADGDERIPRRSIL
jgi:hypothetical protein